MFIRQNRLQYHARPSKPDPLYARKLQELIGGQWGEMSVMLGYLFQGWNCRGPAKYRDMILDIGTEEIGHVEMLATMVARLLESSPVEAQEDAAKDSIVGAVLGGSRVEDVILAGMNPQHAIVSGGGAAPSDSNGNPWSSRYIVSSGNLLADFRFNVTAESQGRLQATRLYALTEDHGVRDLLSFLIARDTMHQNQWLAAIQELEADGLESTPCPSSFPQERELGQVAYQFMNFSEGTESAQGRWARGRAPDGRGDLEYVADPRPMGEAPVLGQVDPRLHGTPAKPVPSGT
ncbi:manganese catalase family protein [Rhodospirillum centenum]|uniref:Manganese containing catalase, putative n=1 Tax=Rhodospirillum centenum (strain ATCC 51521 / SW) TaxID=414684 RepID=B6IUY2_RHOCS|nr:manganese catalase family protein [Rhodospirillum centenum]ACJ00064.1 manganese containing catalase, putative [Rhodospirillum centenum SW]